MSMPPDVVPVAEMEEPEVSAFTAMDPRRELNTTFPPDPCPVLLAWMKPVARLLLADKNMFPPEPALALA